MENNMLFFSSIDDTKYIGTENLHPAVGFECITIIKYKYNMYECMFIVLVCVHTKRCPHSSDGVKIFG